MQERRAQGLCYNCDEKYVMRHKWASGRYLLLIIEPGMEDELEDTPTEPKPQPNTKILISNFPIKP